ncbi:MAG: rod shape-determining protein MreC [Elusimicrobia bacterium]|nr:rod shape-determining protein MreC [Elusimicrobiota bacterium]
MQPHREDRAANIVLASLSAASIVLMFLPMARPIRALRACVAHVFEPMTFAGAEAMERLSLVPSRARQLIVADIENRALKEEMARVGLVKAELANLRAENSRLTAALGLGSPAGRTVLWGRVMERDPVTWYHGVMLDVGSREGVPINAAVLAHVDGKVVVLGRIAEVSEKTSKVLLVTDEFSSVAACLSSGTVEGLVQGQGSERLKMNYLHSEASVTPGDEVLTSATSATFPPGMLIGHVAKGFARDPFLTFQSAEVRPGFDPASVKEVMILR